MSKPADPPIPIDLATRLDAQAAVATFSDAQALSARADALRRKPGQPIPGWSLPLLRN